MITRISITVKANVKENRIDLPKVFVREPAKEGRANEAVIKLLAEYFDIPKSRIKIVSGLKSKKKIVEIDSSIL